MPGSAITQRPDLLSLLAPLSPLYGGLMSLRGWLYDRGWLAIHRLRVPVVSVGNLSVGGTGKSPIVALVARLLAARGARPAIVSRGYGGDHRGAPRVASEGHGALADARQVGDEPVMLAKLVEGVPVIVSRRRRDGGELAVSKFGAHCVILDDGFQHRALARDLDLLLLDGLEPFGGGRTLPAGRLREPTAGMKRADAIIITHTDRSSRQALEEIAGHLARFCPLAPVFHARSRPLGLVEMSGREVLPLETLRGARVVCFAGIAHPERFVQDVEAAGGVVIAALPFADHHRFSDADLSRVAGAGAGGKADLILTTEKDTARLAGDHRARRLKNVYALRMATTVDEEAAFDSLLRRAVP